MSDDGDYDVDGGDFDGDDIDNDIDEAGDEVEQGENVDILPGLNGQLSKQSSVIENWINDIHLSWNLT